MISYLANPERFMRFEKYASPIFGGLALMLFPIGLYLALYASPADYQQGDSVRIMYVHVPAAWSAMLAYTALTVASIVSFIWRHNLADSAAKAFAVPGMAFTFLALATGSIWGKTSWGTWWQWDGRMTSVLILFFIYAAYLLVRELYDDPKKGARIGAVLAMVGFINIPIIKFSVEWWNSLHQPATLSDIGAPGVDSSMLAPWLTMAGAYICLFGWLSLKAVRNDILLARKRRRARQKEPVAQTIMETL